MKRIAVIVRAADPDRVAEALRAAVGLGLRGDRVHVVLAAGAGAVHDHAQAARALATLRMLGHDVVHAPKNADGKPDAAAEAQAVRAADAVEVWT